MKEPPSRELRTRLSGALIFVLVIGIASFAAWRMTDTSSPGYEVAGDTASGPLLGASPSVVTLYLLPVPQGSTLIRQHNVIQVEPGKTQSDFARDASESYRVSATPQQVAAFFREQLHRQGWIREEPDRESDGKITLSYSMSRYSWAVDIVVEPSDSSGSAVFRVSGRKG